MLKIPLTLSHVYKALSSSISSAKEIAMNAVKANMAIKRMLFWIMNLSGIHP